VYVSICVSICIYVLVYVYMCICSSRGSGNRIHSPATSNILLDIKKSSVFSWSIFRITKLFPHTETCFGGGGVWGGGVVECTVGRG
jgi:hypothetical protein